MIESISSYQNPMLEDITTLESWGPNPLGWREESKPSMMSPPKTPQRPAPKMLGKKWRKWG